MNNRYLVILAIVIVGVIAAYGVYHWYSSVGNREAEVDDTSAAGVNESATLPTTPSSSGPASSGETANATNQTTISIPLEKPPFIQ